MPYQTVAIHLQTQLLAVLDKLVGYTEVEDAFCRSQHFGLHAVLSHSTVEMVLEYSVSLWHLSLVDSSTDKAILANGVFESLRT